MKPLRYISLMLIFMLFSADISNAESRAAVIKKKPGASTAKIALVIGNCNYKDNPLSNPANDAALMSKVLTELGFKVTKKINATQKEMKKAIDDFGEEIIGAEVALFYFAGHGAQVNGNNYLLPIGADIKVENDIEYESIDAGRVIGKMDNAKAKFKLVVLDACRNNPFARSFRSDKRGLAVMNAPTGTLIAYATAPGSTAEDGTGSNNGVYTAELAKNIKKSGLK
ncbi:MAG: caspase family protein [Nitrospirae bacterium]|nr:caspase family protein [Nitrospirota bacterium]MBF0533700.1 caspase family protein [Nitrospirota bacterium]MBF0615591.1 caspase family protein [Nitrospirota bacterium]